METPQKAIKFIGSKEFYQMIEQIGYNFFQISWNDDKMPLLINFIVDVIKTNKKGGALKNLAKQYLTFLNEEDLNKFLDYFEENYQWMIDELWQEEVKEPEKPEESYEEREKRYLELIKEILKLESKSEKEVTEKEVSLPAKSPIFEEDKNKIIEESKPEELKKEKPLTEITVTWKTEEQFSKEDRQLPEGTIIIEKKEEKEKIKKSEDILDLSNL